ncbi:MAG: DUF5103 domain-containing protein [Candidatus Methylacidiphilales bacterium]
MKYSILTILFFKSIILFAQGGIDNVIYDKKVQTVQLTINGTDERYPIITLNSSQQLKLSFDIIGNNNEYFQYTVIHCDQNWQPTNMQQNLYLKGLSFDNINDFKFSTNTYVKYVHYNVLVPNENMKPSIAGNYILKVYRNFDETDLVITRRFMILNNQTKISAVARPASLAEYRFTKQELNFTIDYNATLIPNPLQDIKVVILQNNRWDNAMRDIAPQFASNGKLDYNYFDKTLFNGGNEFRFFDIRNLRQFSQNVRTKYFDSVYRCLLNMDEPRGAKQYFQYNDFNGKRVVFNREGNNTDMDGDYALIQFQLSAIANIPASSDVYIIGEFSDWKLKPEYKMSFNASRARYDLEVPFKQGRYEYLYSIFDKELQKPDESLLEGNHANTENEYMILVYNRNLQFNYDELIGSTVFNSNKQ